MSWILLDHATANSVVISQSDIDQSIIKNADKIVRRLLVSTWLPSREELKKCWNPILFKHVGQRETTDPLKHVKRRETTQYKAVNGRHTNLSALWWTLQVKQMAVFVVLGWLLIQIPTSSRNILLVCGEVVGCWACVGGSGGSFPSNMLPMDSDKNGNDVTQGKLGLCQSSTVN